MDDTFGGEAGPWDTKGQARAAEEVYRRALDQRSKGSQRVWLASEYADHHLKTVVSTKEDSTISNYTRAIKLYKEEFGDAPMDDIDRPWARDWAIDQPQGVRDPIRAMHNAALNDGVVKRHGNAFAALGIKKKEARGRVSADRLPSMEEYDRCIALCEPMIAGSDGTLVPGPLGAYGQEMKLMLQVAAWVGPRQGELFAFQEPDLDYENCLIHVHRARKPSGKLGDTKGGADEWVPAPEWLMVALKKRVRKHGDEFIFHSVLGEPLRKGNFNYQWNKLRHAAGLPLRRWHDWRHFCATQLLECGLSAFDVSLQLTHVDGGTLVTERYGHPSHDRGKDRIKMAYGSMDFGSESGSDSPGKRLDRAI